METIAENLDKTRARIDAAEQKYGRVKGSVQLLAVSKAQPVNQIALAVQAGQTRFGENYAQEVNAKIIALRQQGLEWHFIGPIQSNKTRMLAENLDWIHSLDRDKIARRLSESRPAHMAPLNVCIQVNISAELAKSGVEPAGVWTLAQQIQQLPGLRLRGLMVIPAILKDFNEQRLIFRQTRQLLQQLNEKGLQLDTLSMGMSEDLEAAIAEGSTLVRVGTAIFGPRQT